MKKCIKADGEYFEETNRDDLRLVCVKQCEHCMIGYASK